MIEVTLSQTEKISLKSLKEATPLFVKENGTLKGMIIKEYNQWIFKTGGRTCGSNHHPSRTRCVAYVMSLGYKIFVENVYAKDMRKQERLAKKIEYNAQEEL